MRWSLLLCALAGLILLISDADAANEKTKCLIEFGWDEPDTAFLRAHIHQMERSPFDGCVFHADYALTGTNKGSFTWQAWGTQAFTEADLKDAFDDLHATHLGRFKQSFLRFNTTPAKLDWFDDYSAIVANARLAGRLARAGNCPGILFDIEQYEEPLFNYRKQRESETKSWELYADQVRRRGREVMQAFQEGYPGLTVFLTFGYSLPWAQTRNGKKNLADCDYGLLAPFLDGMVEATQGHTRLIDGYERAYGYKTAREFETARKGMKEDLLPIVHDPEKYQRVFSLGFGIWLDKDWRKRAWNTEDLTRNYFSQEAFETSIEEAFRTSDEYVWVYSETPRWWSAEGTPVKLPLPYDQALRRARQRMEALRGR
jgi:hypothetical protein